MNLSQPTQAQPQAGADLIQEGNVQNFMEVVIAASETQPVIVDFWAPWCGPCKQLGPVLEKAVMAAGGKVRMVKIDIDQNQQIAASMRIQSVPTVYAFLNGQPVDGFVGAKSESEVKAFVAKLASMAGDDSGLGEIKSIIAQAEAFVGEGKYDHAASLYNEILRHDARHAGATIGLIRCLMQMGQGDAAKELAAMASDDVKADKEWAGIAKMLALAEKASASAPLEELQSKVEANPADHQARHDYAMALYASGQKEACVDQLLEIMRRDRKWNEGAARVELVNIFEALGHADPLTIDARKRLSTILFS